MMAPPRLHVPVLRDRGRERAADRAADRPAATRGQAARADAPAALGLGAGTSLPSRDRRYFERRLAADLSGVRLHEDAAAATRLGARAFAAGRDIGFAPGEWRPATQDGRRLLGHELAHVVQQGAHGPAVQLEDRNPGALTLEDPMKPAEDALGGGVKTILECAKDNEGVKKALLEPAKGAALGQWDKLGRGEKAGVVGWGAGTYGLALGAGLSDPNGRRLLSDVNLVAPLGLIPYATLSDFRYVLPAAPGGPTQYKASFSGDDLLGLAHDKVTWFPQMSLSFDFVWSSTPGGGVSLSMARANWGVVPGINIAAGTGVALDWKPTVMGPDGQAGTLAKSLPDPGGTSPAGAAVFVTVDLLQAPILPAPVRAALGGPVGRSP